MDEQRRELVGAGVAACALLISGTSSGGEAAEPKLDPIPALPVNPTPGKPGDFDFLTGEWRIHHWQPNAKSREWIEFDGEATVTGILGGIGSVEELRIPARSFSGMGLRLLDIEKRLWSDFWVNSRSGVLTTPGVAGSFENGAGIFCSDDEEDGKPLKAAGVWDLITPVSCRWRQALSRDGGKTWEQTWIMTWKRA
jgi:hypothetical protein